MTEFYFTGKDLIEMGIQPGPQFGKLLAEINRTLQAHTHADEESAFAAIQAILDAHKAKEAQEAAERAARIVPLRAQPISISVNLTAQSPDEKANLDAVLEAMTLLARTPTVEAAAIMPDACPAGAIPVGGVAAARKAIHPGWHSADICCSMFATNFGKAKPKAVLDAVFAAGHFGPGGRKRHEEARMPAELLALLQGRNPFLADKKLQEKARNHLKTQGDGNHFSFVGISKKTGDTWLITHYGSRGFGAELYKAGMEAAERYRQQICPDLDKGHAWIPSDTKEGQDYWAALEIVRAWTKANHALLHQDVADMLGVTPFYQRWNPHNFVFRDPADPDLFWHAKGATPVHNPFLEDTDGTQIIPLNMAQPVLFVQQGRGAGGLGFAPHGAGRNLSRTQHKRRLAGETDESVFARETAGIDARFWSGIIDVSELPSAYKNAEEVQRQMDEFGLAKVVDRILPYGAVMAGDWEKDAPWRTKKARKDAQKNIEPQADSTD